MMRSDASHSIALLKQKFEEIKRNINTIEQKQREFFSSGLNESKPLPVKSPQRPASVKRFADSHLIESDRSEYLAKVIQELEHERQMMMRKMDELAQENRRFKENQLIQEGKIRALQEENQHLKSVIDRNGKEEKRPQSCLRDSKTPQKRNRVAFAKELTSVHHFDNTSAGIRTSPRMGKGDIGNNGKNKGYFNPFHSVGASDRIYSEEFYNARRRIGLD